MRFEARLFAALAAISVSTTAAANAAHVACTNKKAYAIVLNDDGSSAITDCKRLKALSNLDCFKALGAH